MRYLIVKTGRDLKSMWPQFFSVLLMSFLAVFVFAGISGPSLGMRKGYQDFAYQNNLADVWVAGTNITSNDLKAIRQIGGVERADPGLAARTSLAEGHGKPDSHDATVDLTTIRDTATQRPYIVKGRTFDPHSTGIWLDKDFAGAHNLDVGSTVRLSFAGVTHDYLVKGLALSAEYIYPVGPNAISPDHKTYGYAFAGLPTERNLHRDMIRQAALDKGLTASMASATASKAPQTWSMLRLRLATNISQRSVEDGVRRILGQRFNSFTSRANRMQTSSLTDSGTMLQSLSLTFSAMFILLALLTILTSISRLVKVQAGQIATMRALGFRKRTILFHYATYGLIVSAAGTLLGLPASILLNEYLLGTKKSLYSLPHWPLAFDPKSFLLALALVMTCTLAALMACFKALSGTPAEAMRGETDNGVRQRHMALEHITPVWSRIGHSWRWTLRDISQGKTRTLMAAFGVMGSMVLLTAGFGMQRSVDARADNQYQRQYTYASKATLKPGTGNAGRDMVDRTVRQHGTQWIQETTIQYRHDDKIDTLTVMGPGDLIRMEAADGKGWLAASNQGAVLTRQTAQRLNAHVGGTVSFRTPGTTRYTTVAVTGITYSPYTQGVFMTQVAWHKAGGHFSPTALLLSGHSDDTRLNHLDQIDHLTDTTDQYQSLKRFTAEETSVLMVLKLAAVILDIVVLYNLGMLGFAEHEREYATMRVLGFRQQEIRASILRENLTAAIVGWLVGVPAGIAFLGLYTKVASNHTQDTLPVLDWRDFIWESLISLGCALAVALWVSRRAKHIDMVQALKSVD
ncbi:FtsX-like permease family protein [Bifidobacterium sp. ESL0690]|uniref:ABC transporter permease n=1 Tax=Bifidobacterium sp. ESL0690 TaxID=2983214 RepID=UPI0023F69320|nr:FtsX-like permease family protein [Bifidobacterium sp. ESL0690]WEV47745.1 FtsX-like permease family protein [Bifidobacterium sp. ESL0690]